MLGMVGTPPLPVSDVLDAFYPLSKEGCVQANMPPGHLDGWGISGYSGDRLVYFDRRAEPATEGRAQFQKAGQKAFQTQSPVLIAHLRKSPSGGRDLSDTPPFHQKEWVFAHSGTIYNPEVLHLEVSPAQGGTDSEHFMLWLVEHIGHVGDPTPVLSQLLKDWRDRLIFSSLSFLLSNGTMLWAYRDYGDQHLEAGETVQERQKYYTLYSTRVERTAVICSEPLKSLSKFWQPLAQRTLAVFSPQMLAPRTITI
jgi:glutamine amidotransferase